MAAKVNIRTLLTKHLGKEVGDAMAAKIDTMIKAKKSAAQIERTIHAEVKAHITTKLGPVLRQVCVAADVYAGPPGPTFKSRR